MARLSRREFLTKLRDLGILSAVPFSIKIKTDIESQSPETTPEHDWLAEHAMISARQGGSAFSYSELRSPYDPDRRFPEPTADADDYLEDWVGTGGESIVPDWPKG